MCKSTVKYRVDLLNRKIPEVLVTDFFSSTHHIEDGAYLLPSANIGVTGAYHRSVLFPLRLSLPWNSHSIVMFHIFFHQFSR